MYPDMGTASALQDIRRHKTAIGRTSLSRPVKLALADGLIDSQTPLFDYGCGRGDDLRILSVMGYSGDGWDPVHRPNSALQPAPVVNLGYVVNVIEDPAERHQTLSRAWQLAERVLIVSARLNAESPVMSEAAAFADGYVTSRGTFQKLFEQHELRTWIDQVLDTAAVPAGPGVFYAFRDRDERAAFVASRYRRQIVVPRLTRSVDRFETYKSVLQPLMDFFTARGRLPHEDELTETAAVISALGSLKKAFRLIERGTGAEVWAEIAAKRGEDLLVYLALARFDRRPALGRLPLGLQRDIKGLFPSYAEACKQADALLFSVGKTEQVNAACSDSLIGKKTPEALYVHVSAIDKLPASLRVFEGCARAYIGRVEGANIVKLNRLEPKISYLSYPAFEEDPHPALAQSLSVHLQTFRVRTRDYSDFRNPPILHRKETFLPPEHPLQAKFARLTRAEERAGLYADPRTMGTRDRWDAILTERGRYLEGHRLLRRK
jgi:DNA phosphorothioation-associated putative methyltransferase